MNIEEMIQNAWAYLEGENNTRGKVELIKTAIEYEKLRRDKYYEALLIMDRLTESEE